MTNQATSGRNPISSFVIASIVSVGWADFLSFRGFSLVSRKWGSKVIGWKAEVGVYFSTTRAHPLNARRPVQHWRTSLKHKAHRYEKAACNVEHVHALSTAACFLRRSQPAASIEQEGRGTPVLCRKAWKTSQSDATIVLPSCAIASNPYGLAYREHAPGQIPKV